MRQTPTSDHRERDILYRMIQIASSSLRTETILQSVVDVVSEALGCQMCFVYLWDPDEEMLVLRAAPPTHSESIGAVKLELGEGVVGRAAAHRESALLLHDQDADPHYRGIPELDGTRFPAMLSVPIVSRGSALIGAVNVHASNTGEFDEDDRRFLEHTASLIAGAIENAQLYQIAKRKEEALAGLVRETIQVQEEERRRVATEIHDGVTQQLVSIWFRVHACQKLLERGAHPQALQEIEQTKNAIDETLAEARNAIYNLRPATLDDLGLVAALHEFATRYTGETGVKVSIVAPEILRLSPHIETALFRITQEALANVRKHARATTATVTLDPEREAVTLAVADDGCGFDVDAFNRSRSTTSFGLVGMRERVELVGGRMTLRSSPGKGTTLSVTVPSRDAIEVA
ncbi:MAG: GAF domain-containing sensor histidine kinase [Vicinamibacterales bacterium]